MGPEYKEFLRENGLKFSEKVGLFQNWVFLQKRSSLFSRGSWCSVPLRWALGAWVCPVRSLTRHW